MPCWVGRSWRERRAVRDRIAVAWVGAACLALLAPAASAQERAPDEAPDLWDTFVYERPAPTYRLRLAIEQVAILGVTLVGYSIQDPAPPIPGVPATTVWDKVRFAPGSWYLDSDPLSLNFARHPFVGTLYYMVARGNRVSVTEAFLWTIGSSTVWELIEYKEPASINDAIVTPVAGAAIGEAFTQLSGWFDRAGGNGLYEAFAWIFNPVKKIHDWMDGAVPLRVPDHLGWHEFRADASAGLIWQGQQTYPALGVDFATRLFRAPGYGEAGGTGFGFADGNVSAIAISATWAASRSVDFLFDTETALLGCYARDLRTEGTGLGGWDLFVGATIGYEFGSHVWDLANNGPSNQIAMVRFPGADARVRVFAGELELDVSVDVALDFAGVEPIGMPSQGSLPPGQSLPLVYQVQYYYYALGLHLAPALEVRYGPAALGLSLRADWFRGLTGPFIPPPDGQVVSLSDSRSTATAWFRYRLTSPSLEFALRGAFRDRRGTVGDQETVRREGSLLASFGVVF
jgi:hypothetical protein